MQWLVCLRLVLVYHYFVLLLLFYSQGINNVLCRVILFMSSLSMLWITNYATRKFYFNIVLEA